MNKILTAIISLLSSTTLLAERIDGPANVRQEVKGEIAFSLNDNVEVDIGELKNDWYQLVVSLRLTEKQYEEGVIKKGEKLYNGKGDEIGVALKDLIADSRYQGGGAPGVPKWYGADVYGFTFKSNIRPESIVEPVLAKLIESNRQDLTYRIFKAHMEYFGYVEGLKVGERDKYKTYMIYESMVDDISPLDRVRLIFEDEDLIAVVHSRALAIAASETIPIERERKLTLIKKFSAQEKTAFIEKNKEAYRGVD